MDDWKKDLSRYFEGSAAKDQQDQEGLAENRDTAARFYASVVAPAFDDLKTELAKYGRTVRVSLGRDSGSITVEHEGEAAYKYSVRTRVSPAGVVAYPETTTQDPSFGRTNTAEGYFRSGSQDSRKITAEGYFRSGSQDYGAESIAKEEIIKHFVNDYTMYLDALKRHGRLPR